MAAPILKSASEYVTAYIDAVVAARPSTLVHFNNPNSVYGALPAMARAQVLLLLARLGDEIKSARLKFATGAALRSLAASEFRTQLPPNPQTALASVTMTRTTGSLGIVKQGTSFTKAANSSAIPLPIAAAAYTTSAPVYVQENQTSVTFPLIATAAGVNGNLPIFFGQYLTTGLIVPAGALFDTTFVAGAAAAAGGSSGLPDPVVVAAAKAYVVGQFGPTVGAAIAGLLAQQSVRHYAVFPASATLPYGSVYVADESWADAGIWHNQVAQNLATAWQGFGCRMRFGLVSNKRIAMTASFILNDTDDLNDTSDIDVQVRTVAESYFNDRPDWYRFRMSTLQQLLSSADSRIRRCTGVVVTDVVTGDPIQEPANNFTQEFQSLLTHFYLTDAGVNTSYSPPQ
jgi:hypothetical protein